MNENAPQSPSGDGGHWRFDPGSALAATPQQPPLPSDHPISWTASEYIAHQKSFGWYALLGLGAIVLVALVFLITKDVITTGAIVITVILFGIMAGHKPRTLEYVIDRAGLRVGQKFYDFNQFRSFSLIEEGAFSSVVFMPLKRFMPPLTIYYDPKDEPRIIGAVSGRLPMEEPRLDAVDRLLRRIRF